MIRVTRYDSCSAVFTVTKCDAADAALRKCKVRSGLVDPNIHFHQFLKAAEQFFSKNAQQMFTGTPLMTYWKPALSLPCNEHKGDMISQVLQFHISMCTRQHCKYVNLLLKKEASKT